MATRFYLTNFPAEEDFTADIDLLASRAHGDEELAGTCISVAGPVSPAQIQAKDDPPGSKLLWYSRALKGVNISSTVTFNVWAAESDAAANACVEAAVIRANGTTGAEISTIIDSERGTELAAGAQALNNWSAAPTSTTLSDGERLGFFVYYNDATALTMQADYFLTLTYGSPTPSVAGDTWFEFSETIETINRVYTVVNGSDEQLVNVNAAGTDIDAYSYKDGVSLTDSEMATLLSASFGKKNVYVIEDLTGDSEATERKRAVANSCFRVSS